MAKASEWAARVAEWRKSGLVAKEFCAAHGYSPGSLLWWSSQLRKKAQVREQAKKPVGFARVVRPTSRTKASAPIVVEFGEAKVVVDATADREVLRAVFDALRSSAKGAR